MLGADVCLLVASYYLAYCLRFEGEIPESFLSLFRKTAFLVVAVKLLSFFYFNLYRGMWRYTGLADFVNVVKAVGGSTVVLAFIFMFLFGFPGFSRSVLMLDFLLTLVFIAGVRLAIRMYLTRNQYTFASQFWKKKGQAKRLLLIGAGNTGEHVLREMMDNPAIRVLPVGFIDDDPTKKGKSIHGVPVLGNVDQIDMIRVDFDEILISAPSATGRQMRRIMAACERTGKPVKTMPPLGELIDGRVSMKMVRTVSLTDLVGREEVRLDEEDIRGFLQGKRVMVTGAGGSIGSELVRQIGRFEPRAAALVDFSEFNLYRVEIEYRERLKGADVRAYLVDLGDLKLTRRVFRDFKPDVIFHAAAYKHVPMQEVNPWEAVFNNVLSMRHLVRCAIEGGVEKFVLVSTDKAVRPTNVMGATKRVCEMIATCANLNNDGALLIQDKLGPLVNCSAIPGDVPIYPPAPSSHRTRFISVRFGNVLGSSGSVIPLFQHQIAHGGPVTVTHPEIIRYFMSIPEAAQLILQASAMGKGREIFILKMGEPVKILDIAKDVIRLAGYEPMKDIEIVFSGLRPGEKLYEELITEGEDIVPTTHEKIMVLQSNNCINPSDLTAHLDELIQVAGTFDILAIKEKLKEIVPEYTPQ